MACSQPWLGGRKGRTDGWTSAIRAASVSPIGLGAGSRGGPGELGVVAGHHPRARGRPPGRARRGPVPPRDRAGGALDRGDAARPGARGRHRAPQGRALLPRPARGAVPGRHPQHQAAPGRVQVPRGDGHQLGAPAGADRGGPRPAPADALGPRQLQEVAGAGHQGRRLDSGQGGRGAAAQARPGEGRVHPRDGRLGLRRGRRRRRRALPHGRGGRDDGAALALRRPRPAQHRPQADLRHAVLADLAGDRLAARRARPPLARLRPARPDERLAPRLRRALRGQPRERQEDPRRLAGRQARPERDARAPGDAPPGVARGGLGRGSRAPEPRGRPRIALGRGGPGRQRDADAEPQGSSRSTP